MKEISVEKRVRDAKNTPLSGKFNLVQFKKEKAKAMLHKSVCEQVVEYADAHTTIPFYVILSMGIAAGAFKNSEFDRGYKKFDAEKVDTTYKMAKAYNEKMGIKGQASDVTWRLVGKFYKEVSTSYEDFLTALAKAKVLKNADSREADFSLLCKNIGIK
jgi:hypothetical protein